MTRLCVTNGHEDCILVSEGDCNSFTIENLLRRKQLATFIARQPFGTIIKLALMPKEDV